jgi:TP901 family phage tail tape measure protein
MPKEKKIVVGLELKDKKFLTGLSQINKSVQDVGKTVKKIITETGGDFATLSGKIDQTKGAINRGNTTMTTMVKVLREIRTHLADLKGSVGTTNTALDTLNKTAGRTETGIKQIKGAVNQVSTEVKQFSTSVNATIASTNQLANANMQVAQSFNAVGQAAQTSSSTGLANVQNAYDRLRSSGRNALGSISSGGVGEFIDIFNPARVAKAAGWNMAYKIADAPMRAFQGIASGAKQAIDNTSKLEGTMFDLQAYLGGAAQDEFQKLAKTMGKTGTDEQLNDAGLEILQQKILLIGQQSTFTAAQIADAAQNAAKAGVSLEEIAGEGGTALESINYLAQNTGESLESSATQVAKLQALFESNLAKSQQAMGQSVHAGKQYQMIVDGLATADMSSAASAQELTQALFNVGGSASNLNMSFFETVSLVSQMVPAFESAASAGTSLKYVFSGISGGRSIKAKGAMQRFNLMDQFGQSVFFGKNEKTGKTEFKGIEFMTEKLREVFGDESGMAVDVRNRVITDIFGQDALKAVSRMVSMTDEQAQEMYKMAADMTSNAASGVEAAANLAMIKNEGLEFDIEYFRGTIDALQTTLTMPLMKPMSNFVKTFSSIGDAAFAVLTDAKDADTTIKTIKTEFMGTSLLPGAEALMDTAVKFARTLGGVLKVITTEGYSISSVSKAIATLFGGSKNEISARAAEFEGLLKRTYAGLEKFVKTVPSMLEKLAKGSLIAFDALIRALTWIAENWETVYKGIETVISALIVSKVVSFTTEIGNMGIALFDMAKGAKAAGGWLATIAGINTGYAGGITQLVQGAAGKLSGAAGASAIPTMSGVGSTAAAGAQAAAAGATATNAAAKSIPILVRLVGAWQSFTMALGAAKAALTSVAWWFGTGILVGKLLLVAAVLAGLAAAWQNNTANLASWTKKHLAAVGAYFSDFANLFAYVWDRLSTTFTSAGTRFQDFWTWFSELAKGSVAVAGLAEMAKGVMQILEGLLVFVGGVFKLLIGLITFDYHLIGEALTDIGISIVTAVAGVFRTFSGLVETAVGVVVDAINKISETLTGNKLISFDLAYAWEKMNNFLEVGAGTANDIDKGYRQGLKDATKGTAAATSAFVNKAITGPTTSILLTNSPSIWAYARAQDIGAGFIEGFYDVTDKVADAMATMMHVSIDRTNQTITKSVATMQKNVAGMTTATSSPALTAATKNVASPANKGTTEEQFLERAERYDKTGQRYAFSMPRTTFVPDFLKAGTSYIPQAAGYNPNAKFSPGYSMPGDSVSGRDLAIAGALAMDQKFIDHYQELFPDEKIDKTFILNTILSGMAGYGETTTATRDAALKDVANSLGFESFNKYATSQQGVNAVRDAENVKRATATQYGLNPIRDPQTGERLQITNPKELLEYFSAQTPTYRESSRGGPLLSVPTKFMKKQTAYMEDNAYFSELTTRLLDKRLRPSRDTFATNEKGSLLYRAGETFKQSDTQIKNAMGMVIGEFDKSLGKYVVSLDEFNQQMQANGAAYGAIFGDVFSNIKQNLTLTGNEVAVPTDDITRYTQGAANLFGQIGDGKVTLPYVDPYNIMGYVEKYLGPSQYLGQGVFMHMGYTKDPNSVDLIETSYEARDLTPEEMNARNKPLDFVPVTQLPQMGSFFTDSIIPESYDGPSGMVSPDIAAYKQLYGEKGIEYHGLTKLFQSTPTLVDQYAQVGNRAATFLSMKQGKLNPEDYKTFQELLALDQKDKDNFLAASKTLAAEQNKIMSDPALTQEQKNTNVARLQNDFTYNNRAMAGSYRDVLGVKVGGLADYDTAVSEGKISEQAKPYTDTAFQRVREAYANALDPKNQSEAFKKLSPEEQDRIKEAALQLPLQTQAYYNSAIADGVITDTERKLLEQYSGDDAAAVAALIASATLPTQDQLNAAYAPYLHGTATVTAASNITGVAAPAFLAGLANIVTATAVLHGQEYANAFIQGIATDAEGNKIGLASVTVLDALSADPASIVKNGIKAGESLPEGIWQGIANGTKVLAYKVTKYFGPANESGDRNLIKVVREAIKAKSPSGLYRDFVGLPIIEGVAEGITDNKYLVEKALKDAIGIGSGTISAGLDAGSGVNDPEAGAFSGSEQTVSPYFLMGQSASKDFVRGFVNAEDPINAFSVALMTAISNPFNPQSMESSVLTMFAKVIDFGKKIGRVLIDDGFTPVIDGKTEEPWTFATVVGLALAHTVSDEEGKWRPQAEALGKSISLGIAAGIADGEAVGKMIANVEAAVQAALKAGQDEINANSPSRLFADKIGSPITEGIARGITDSSYMLDSAMGGLMDGATRNYRPDISPVALAGQRQAQINAQNTYNYNLGVHTSQNPQVVQRSFAVMQSFTGES